jgi:hypothetical protein
MLRERNKSQNFLNKSELESLDEKLLQATYQFGGRCSQNMGKIMDRK